jgi:hypothetical protein
MNDIRAAARAIVEAFAAIPDVDDNPEFWGDEQDRSDFFENLAEQGLALANLILTNERTGGTS